MSTRSALAAAVNAITGPHTFQAHEHYTPDTAVGTTHIRLERIDYPDPFGGVAHWNVVVIVPQEQGEAERYVEAVLPVLLPAVGEHLAVTSAAPQQINLPGVGVLLALFINGHREAD